MKNRWSVAPYLFCRIGKIFLMTCFWGLYGSMGAYAQINAYAKVTAISGKTLTLSNINQSVHTFTAGEPVLIIQMKDNVIGANTANTAAFGSISSIANAGVYEVAAIATVSGTTMTLTANPAHTYNTATNASVQVVSFNVLSTTDYTTGSAITAIPWDGNVGGIVAFQVGGTLTLANSVSADGLGFRGGGRSGNFQLNCEPNVYDNISSNYAFKGEGIDGSTTITYTTHTGRGPLANGGGGGSDDNAGGGGGGNYTAGGQGGPGWGCTGASVSGGLGGVVLGPYISGGRVFMGGGGGGGQQNNSVASVGSAGGGIIFIKANKLVTSCSGSVSISASGAAAANSGGDGSGGAGGGGGIVLAINTFAVPTGCPLNIKASGGNGGNVIDPSTLGGGGGGGQGTVIFSASLPTANITTAANNGIGGFNISDGSSSAGNGTGINNAGIMSGVPILLPVDFLSFSAAKSGQQNILSWTVSQLYQYTQFSIQRSSDGVSFRDIGTVDGIVDGRSTANYVFTDPSPSPGKNYYRVRQTDLSGAEKYTVISLVDWTDAVAAFRISPNPAHGSFTIQLLNVSTGPVMLSIEDISGAVVYRSSSMANSGRIAVSLNKAVPAGIYFIRVRTATDTETGKIILN